MESLLDNENIEANLPSSLRRELEATGRWLLIFAVAAFLFGGIFSFWGLVIIADYADISYDNLLLAFVFLISGLFLLYWGYLKFRYARAIHWVDDYATSYSIDDVIQYNYLTWRWFAYCLIWIFSLIALSYWTTMGYVASPEVIEPVPAVVEPDTGNRIID